MAASPKVVTSPTGKRRTMFIPVGIPGSGKTWIADRLDRANFMVINQEERRWSFDTLHRHVLWCATGGTNQHLYIDSCNHSKKRRRVFANIGLRAGMQVVFLVFALPVMQCELNTMARLLRGDPHPSIVDSASAARSREVIYAGWQNIDFREQRYYGGNPAVSYILIEGTGKADELIASLNARA